MSNYQPENQQTMPQTNMGQAPVQQVYGVSPYQVMDNPAGYAQYNQGAVPNMQVGNKQVENESGFDKFLKGVIAFIAKLAGKPAPKPGVGNNVPNPQIQQQIPQQTGQQVAQYNTNPQVPNQQYIPNQQYQNQQYVPNQQVVQQPVNQGVVGGLFQGIQNMAQNIGNMAGQVVNTGQGIYQGAKETVQQIQQAPAQTIQEVKKPVDIQVQTTESVSFPNQESKIMEEARKPAQEERRREEKSESTVSNLEKTIQQNSNITPPNL